MPNLWGDTESVLLKNYFITSPDLVTEKGSTLKGNIVNLLAVDSQPNTSNVAFDDPNAIEIKLKSIEKSFRASNFFVSDKFSSSSFLNLS